MESCRCCCCEVRVAGKLYELRRIRFMLALILVTTSLLLQSLDYDKCINEPHLEVLETLDNKKVKRYEVVKWVLVFCIGVCTGLVGLFIEVFVHLLSQLKFQIIGRCILSFWDLF
uniref:Uncharacterized protein n=1 Tax=Callorhinchus milii TaxID=7868 RepID=A0A4W3HDQ3_CALMI